MGDFPRPFSGNKTKKQSKDHFKKYIEEASILTSAGKPAKTRVFDFDDKLAAKEPTSKKTKEMGGPNMKAPLEKALVGNQPNLNEGLKAAIEASPATMISTGMAGVDPMTGMPQANQLAPTAINPNALGSMQPQIPSIAGTPQAGSYNNVMPQPAQAGLAAPLQHKIKKTHIHPTEFTGKIKTKEDGQEYSLIELDGSQKVSDTLTPAGLKFPKGLVSKEGYLKGSMDLPAFKTGDKKFTLN
jgi:hypothetical protein